MNGEGKKIDDKKSWDLSNWGVNKEDMQQTQNEISQKHNALSTDTIENNTQKDVNGIDSNDGH